MLCTADEAKTRADVNLAPPPSLDSSVLQCTIAYNEYGGYCVPRSSAHRPAAQAILSGRVWEPQTIQFMVAHSTGGDIVHAGTYFGDFLPALSRTRQGGTQVWAFEPNLESFRCAQVTMTINGITSIRLRNAGLGESAAVLPMKVCDKTGRSLGGASRIFESGHHKNPEQFAPVEIVSLDDVLPADRHIGLIQLDVEGFEKQALCGALKTIRRCLPVLILENTPAMAWLDENILALGYREDGRINGNTVFMPHEARSAPSAHR